jgi:SAM-dependent methyltransferase
MTANQAQLDAWNGESGTRWVAEADRRDRVLAPVADVLLDAVALQPGEDVLDVGCGCGVTTIEASRRSTPGRAVGIDVSAPMLELARQRAVGTSAQFLEADAQTHPLDPAAFDVIIGRFGTMFFDDPVGAFTNLGLATRPGGRLCLATWQPLEANDWLLVPGAVLLRHGSLPDLEDAGPGMFAQADPAAVTAVLELAGWSDVHVDAITVSLRLGEDAEDATDYLAETGIARRVLDTIPEEQRAEIIGEVADLLETCLTNDGVRLGGGINLIHARR